MDQSETDCLAKERTVLAGQRTHLAMERTFSAWIRTGLAGVGGGFAIIRLISFQSLVHKTIANIAGEFLIAWGIGVFIFALLRYKKGVEKLEKTTNYLVPIGGIIAIVVGLVLVSLTLLLVI